ncbi:DUF6246 family protein [Arsenophonus sp. aPb]|uniref:DUF6246 family protein n=1 Tax=Arsenophonus sp. aPb TaxID=3041619 RepID=UPI00246995D6|nr:DUF6246 family protein [Arsenophonus sp. aPb]WGL99166.1 DUF6246 family protein [Arsenophonus sp. aPb]
MGNITPILDIGEMVISLKEKDYFFRPSFENLTRIGTPKEIVAIFTQLNQGDIRYIIHTASIAYGKLPSWLIEALNKPVYGRAVLSSAMTMVQACCDKDCDELVGEWLPGKRGLIYRAGLIEIKDIITIGKALASHGIIGKANVRKLQRHENKTAFADEFKVIDYINAARAHFNMTRDEAAKLTMTEFQLMLNAKFPSEKGFTREEYDKVVNGYFEMKRKRLSH